MNTYRVWAKSISYCYADIKAESEEEALKIADEMDGGEFIACPDGDWETLPDVEKL